MGTPEVTLRRLDKSTLAVLLDTAVRQALPGEVMAPMPGPPGWTDAAPEAFLGYHRRCRDGDGDGETTYAVVAGSAVVGAVRLAPVDGDLGVTGLEVGIWLGRDARGRGIAPAAVRAAADLARTARAPWLVAVTTPGNAAALATLRRLGFDVDDQSDPVVAGLNL